MGHQAARVQDPVEHGWGLFGMVAGALVGAVVGAAIAVGTVATGGGLLVGIVAVSGVASDIALGGELGGAIARTIQRVTGSSGRTSGHIGKGLANVRIGRLAAARATDPTASCDGGFLGVAHFTFPMPIAQGSARVRINGKPAARAGDKLICGADIAKGSETVYIGGGQTSVLEVDDAEEDMEDAIDVLEWVGVAGGLVKAAKAGGRLLFKEIAVTVVDKVIDHIPMSPAMRDIVDIGKALFELGSKGRSRPKGR